MPYIPHDWDCLRQLKFYVQREIFIGLHLYVSVQYSPYLTSYSVPIVCLNNSFKCKWRKTVFRIVKLNKHTLINSQVKQKPLGHRDGFEF